MGRSSCHELGQFAKNLAGDIGVKSHVGDFTPMREMAVSQNRS